MKEQILKEYFDGNVSADTLAFDLQNSQLNNAHNTASVQLTSVTNDEEYIITREHLIKLCIDTIAGMLTPIDLNEIAFGLISSDYFCWDNSTNDGEIVAVTLFAWDNPDINFPITNENLRLWRKYLETGEYSLK